MVKLALKRLIKKKIMFFLPLFVLGVVLPLLSVFFYRHYSGDYEEFISNITLQMHVWIPMCSVWWVILLFNDFFEDEGNELLYIYFRPKQLFAEHISIVILYVASIVVFFGLFRIFVPLEIFVSFQLIAESFVISSATYFLCFAFQKTGTGLLMAMVYCIYLNLFDTLKLLKFLSVFPESSAADVENIELIKVSVIISFLFLFSGFLLSKFHKTFK